ncbi:TrbI/VirB10 family protein [Comamonas testosteroni]|jgi:type IV secretory pathway VirB10-like protein|uniref:TrbI/VirB10 family protein n=1 Tax=Comamonas testosteroni TaxID=285 RepID=UPI0026F2F44D|nr:TrbI/VirB10 family protein [Comamonas testosteroni]
MSEKKLDPFDEESGVPKIEGELKPKPKFSDRISKRVLWVVFAVGIAFFSIFFMALDNMDKKKARNSAEAENKPKTQNSGPAPEPGAPKELLDAQPNKELPSQTAEDDLFGKGIGSASLANPGAASPPASLAPLGAQPGVHTADNGLGQASAAPSAPVVKQLTPAEQAAQIALLEREKRTQQARNAGLSAKPYAADDKKLGGPAGVDPTALMKTLTSQAAQLGGGQGGIGLSAGVQQGPRGDSEQDEKLEFLKSGGRNPKKYLENSPESAVSANELKRGSYLPMRLEGDVNSGQPGMVRARVTEDIYDTVTGCRLLVPAMTVVQGTYNSKVALGQTRNLVVWNYMGFEDGSDLDLGAMQGYDSKGAAGMEADVDNHYMRLFGMAFGMSMVTAGVQMSVPQSANQNSNTQTPQQAIANALTQQYGQLGAQLLGKYMQIQPTLRNYAGERFNVMLPLTVVFKKVWRNRCVEQGGA